jgi:hypothetical protein
MGMVWILAGVEENGSSFARMPTHVAIRLRHEWGTRCRVGLIYGPPAVDGERVRLAGFFDHSFQGVLGFRGLEEGKTAVTAEGDEVELACLLSSFEAYGHGLDFSRCGGEWFDLRSNAHSCRNKTAP